MSDLKDPNAPRKTSVSAAGSSLCARNCGDQTESLATRRKGRGSCWIASHKTYPAKANAPPKNTAAKNKTVNGAKIGGACTPKCKASQYAPSTAASVNVMSRAMKREAALDIFPHGKPGTA